MRLRRATLMLFAVALALPAVATAEAVDRATFTVLAHRAQTSQSDLDRLRAVESVDGRPVDLRTALDGSSTGDRLIVLAGDLPASGSVLPINPNDAAKQILDDSRFKQRPTEDAGWLTLFGRWLRELFSFQLGGGGGSAANLVLYGLIVLAVGFVIYLLVTSLRRSARAAIRGDGDVLGLTTVSEPDALDRDAEAHEGRGDYEAAIKLRVAAGLIRLERADLVKRTPDLTIGAVSRELRVAPFRAVAGTFDSIVYGRREALASDAETVRDGLRDTLVEVGKR